MDWQRNVWMSNIWSSFLPALKGILNKGIGQDMHSIHMPAPAHTACFFDKFTVKDETNSKLFNLHSSIISRESKTNQQCSVAEKIADLNWLIQLSLCVIAFITNPCISHEGWQGSIFRTCVSHYMTVCIIPLVLDQLHMLVSSLKKKKKKVFIFIYCPWQFVSTGFLYHCQIFSLSTSLPVFCPSYLVCAKCIFQVHLLKILSQPFLAAIIFLNRCKYLKSAANISNQLHTF